MMLVNDLERLRRKLMCIHAIQTGTVAIKQRQVHGTGQGLGVVSTPCSITPGLIPGPSMCG
jgi:hypothetical protein